jgi:hypothetical protein
MDEMTNTNQQIAPVLALRDQLRIKRQKLVEKLAEVDKELESADVIIRLLGHKDTKEHEEAVNVSPKELHGMTQLDALIYIARKNKNRIKITQGARLLSAAGRLSGAKKNWYNMLVTIIKRSELFEHVGPGEFALLRDEQPVVSIRRAPGA